MYLTSTQKSKAKTCLDKSVMTIIEGHTSKLLLQTKHFREIKSEIVTMTVHIGHYRF